MRRRFSTALYAALAASFMTEAAGASAFQTPQDRADPSVIEQELKPDERIDDARKPSPPVREQGGRTDITQSVVAGSILVRGATILRPADFAPVIEKYVGRILSPADLRSLASDIANVARRAGFGLATAWVPQQRISNGMLEVVIDEGRIDALDVQGEAQAAVRRILAPLLSGDPVRTVELERQLLIAEDVAGVRLGKPKLVRRDGRATLVLRTSWQRVDTDISVDNWGYSAVGPIRARMSVDFNGVLADDDRLTLGAVTTPFQPEEFGLVRAAYAKGLGGTGTSLSVGGYYAKSQPSGVLAARDVDGRSIEGWAGVRHAFLRSRAESLWGSIDFRIRDSIQTRADAAIREDRLSLLSASAFAAAQHSGGWSRARLAVRQGLDLFDATRARDPLASRRDGSAIFTKVEFWIEGEQRLGRGISIWAQAEGQAASRPLLSSEEMGLGGRYFGRAWDYREFSGDRGVAAAVELRAQIARSKSSRANLEAYGYFDAGKVKNLRGGFGGGELASAGGGLRLGFAKGWKAEVELGVPLTDGFDKTRDDEPRLSFTLGARF